MSTLFYTISLFVHNVRRSQQSLLKMQNISYRAILFCMSGSICSIKAYAWWCWWRSSRCFESGQDNTDTKHHEVIRSKFVIFLSACKSIYERSWSLMYSDVFWCIFLMKLSWHVRVIESSVQLNCVNYYQMPIL